MELLDHKIKDITEYYYAIKIDKDIFYYTEWGSDDEDNDEEYIFKWELRDNLKQIIENPDLIEEIQVYLDELDKKQ